MLFYKDKSHEELRWEDYQLGVKSNSPTSSAPIATSNQAVLRGGFQSSTFPKWGSQNIFGFPFYHVSSFVPPRNGKVPFK
ncbi:hypothetical protein MKW98_012853 [Papaver atlanticum]|uniref:Uncharacterized protein n=1 Tax=Papaver atlanticum TaxID=357466 RepID=A0AAD4S1N2_9MAGN|nr:hypothetical protein MKW98_012853 [Papaver atlanticum]